MKLSERLQGLKEEIGNEITLSPELENSMDRCIEASRHLEGKCEWIKNWEDEIELKEMISPRSKESYGLNVEYLSLEQMIERYPDLNEHQIKLLKSYSEALPKVSDCSKIPIIFGTGGSSNLDVFYDADNKELELYDKLLSGKKENNIIDDGISERLFDNRQA